MCWLSSTQKRTTRHGVEFKGHLLRLHRGYAGDGTEKLWLEEEER